MDLSVSGRKKEIVRFTLNIYLNCLNFILMPKKDPWHSIKQDVHHNNTNCNTGNNIERENLRQGTGGKPLCKECEKATKEGR